MGTIGDFICRNPQSAIRNPQSAIRNPQSAIRNPQSAIRNPQSAIRNPQSAFKAFIALTSLCFALGACSGGGGGGGGDAPAPTPTPAPKINSVSPTTAAAKKTQIYQINGSDLPAGLTVKLGADACQNIQRISASQYQATCTASKEGTIKMTFSAAGKDIGSAQNISITAAPITPAVKSVRPNSAQIGKAQIYQINGSDLPAGLTVKLGADACQNIKQISASQYQATCTASKEGAIKMTFSAAGKDIGSAQDIHISQTPPKVSLQSMTPAVLIHQVGQSQHPVVSLQLAHAPDKQADLQIKIAEHVCDILSYQTDAAHNASATARCPIVAADHSQYILQGAQTVAVLVKNQPQSSLPISLPAVKIAKDALLPNMVFASATSPILLSGSDLSADIGMNIGKQACTPTGQTATQVQFDCPASGQKVGQNAAISIRYQNHATNLEGYSLPVVQQPSITQVTPNALPDNMNANIVIEGKWLKDWASKAQVWLDAAPAGAAVVPQLAAAPANACQLAVQTDSDAFKQIDAENSQLPFTCATGAVGTVYLRFWVEGVALTFANPLEVTLQKPVINSVSPRRAYNHPDNIFKIDGVFSDIRATLGGQNCTVVRQNHSHAELKCANNATTVAAGATVALIITDKGTELFNQNIELLPNIKQPAIGPVRLGDKVTYALPTTGHTLTLSNAECSVLATDQWQCHIISAAQKQPLTLELVDAQGQRSMRLLQVGMWPPQISAVLNTATPTYGRASAWQIMGRYLPNTDELTVNLAGACTNITASGGYNSDLQFSCTPQRIGTVDLVIAYRNYVIYKSSFEVKNALLAKRVGDTVHFSWAQEQDASGANNMRDIQLTLTALNSNAPAVRIPASATSASVTLATDANLRRSAAYQATLNYRKVDNGDLVVLHDSQSPVVGFGNVNDTNLSQCSSVSGTQGANCDLAIDNASQADDIPKGQDGAIATGKNNTHAMDLSDVANHTGECVVDERTGLMWEVKNNDPKSLHYYHNQFFWHNPDPLTNGGITYLPSNGNHNICYNHLPSCTTLAYIAAVNQNQLCGFADWRLPTATEALSLINFGRTSAQENIDAAKFPYARGNIWTSQVYALEPINGVRAPFLLRLEYGDLLLATYQTHIMLVRSAK